MIVIKDMKMPDDCYDCCFAVDEETNDYGSFCKCGILNDYETINLLEHNKAPNCPLIEQETILDKISVEIIKNSVEGYKYHGCGEDDLIIETSEVLQIIDKYRTESEDKG